MSVVDAGVTVCEVSGVVSQAIRPAAQAGDKMAEFSPLALFAFFVNRCRQNLHILLAFSPIGDAFRNRLRKFPSLINCCTIDWFQASARRRMLCRTAESQSRLYQLYLRAV